MTTEPPRVNGTHHTAARYWVVRGELSGMFTVVDRLPGKPSAPHGRVIGPIADKETAWKIANAYNGAR